MMYTPHVVIIEVRSLPLIADKLYHKTVQKLEQAHIGHSRVSIPSLLAAPIAIRIIIEATRGAAMSGSDWRRPDGYILLGCLIHDQEPYAETTYRETIRSVQDLACYYTIPVGYALVFNKTSEIAETQMDASLENIHNCLTLMDLKKQMGLTPGSILTP